MAGTIQGTGKDNEFAISLLVGLLIIIGLFGTKKPNLEPSDILTSPSV